LTDNTYRDLIASGEYSYARFVESFDEVLLAEGLEPEVDEEVAREVPVAIERGERRLRTVKKLDDLVHTPFTGRRLLSILLHPTVRRTRNLWRAWRYRRFRRTVASEGKLTR
jgi:hypothetical protein